MMIALTADYVDGCLDVVRSLPEWFSYPGALEGVEHAARTQEGFVDLHGGAVVGFVMLTSKFPETLEITFLAVHREHHRSGIGKRLVIAARDIAESRAMDSISLLTLGPASKSPFYAETIAFYQSIGFWRTNELYLADWGGSPTLVMTAAIANLAR